MDAPERHEGTVPDNPANVPPDGYEILLIEDNPRDADLLRLAFAESRPETTFHVATTGEEALTLLADESGRVASSAIDVVVLDLDLPGMNGLEVLDELKRDPSTVTTPVLVMSTVDDDETVRAAYENGANAYLRKRADFEGTAALVEALETFWLAVATLPD